MKRHVLDDGTRLATSSKRALVTFVISDDSYVAVFARTDDMNTADKNHRLAASRGYLRVVTIDFIAPAWNRVRRDTATERTPR